jgi:predicted NBD/HSP70 family sugar kinase
MPITAGIDLGGTTVNYTLLDATETFLIEDRFEHPARVEDGPDVCVRQIAEGLRLALAFAGIPRDAVAAAGVATPGPASKHGVLSARGSTNFAHRAWAGFDLRGRLGDLLGIPVVYLNDGNAAAVWGHHVLFGLEAPATSIAAVVGTGLGGGIIVDGRIVSGGNGFGGELGHVLIPYTTIPGIDGLVPRCNCGRVGDVESLCSLTAIRESLLPYYLRGLPAHALAGMEPDAAAKAVRGLAEAGDALCLSIFRVQAHALALLFDQLVNVLDPDGLLIGGVAIGTSPVFQRWFIEAIQQRMPAAREEQSAIPLLIMPNGDTAAARGAALAAAALFSAAAA